MKFIRKYIHTYKTDSSEKPKQLKQRSLLLNTSLHLLLFGFLIQPNLSWSVSKQELLMNAGREAGNKAVNKRPLYPLPFYKGSTDFTAEGINSLSPLETEWFRKGFTEGLSTKLGGHFGWKYGLTVATPTVPSLGYEHPIYGEILKKMLIVGNEVNVNPNYALSTALEADLLFVVKSSDINGASTPLDILNNVCGVFPAIELPATYTPKFLPDALGPRAGGDGVLRATNIGSRLWVRGKGLIPIPGQRSLSDWQTVLNGGLQVKDFLVRGTGNISGTGGPVPHLTNLMKLVNDLNAQGITLHPGDLISPGLSVTTRVSNGTEKSFTTTYYNLDPNGQVSVKVTFTADGLTEALPPFSSGMEECGKIIP